jgi:hypothetical protein
LNGEVLDYDLWVGNGFDPGIVNGFTAHPVRLGTILNQVVAGTVAVDSYPHGAVSGERLKLGVDVRNYPYADYFIENRANTNKGIAAPVSERKR